MCSGVTILLARSGVGQGWRLAVAHAGRVMMYAFLGGVAGALGLAVRQSAHAAMGENAGIPNTFNLLQGGLALATAGIALYMALALLGRAPSPELYLSRLARRWGNSMRQLHADRFGGLTPFVAGLLWGLLPCGLVLTALLTAVVAGNPATGAGVMATFGAGTVPLLLTISQLSKAKRPPPYRWMRTASAMVVALFGVQLALRGLAAWGWVGHLHVGNVMVW